MDSRELYRIALGQKWVIGLIAAMLLVIILLSLVAQGTNLSSLTPVFRVLGWVYAVTFIYWIVNLARGLANPISWFFGRVIVGIKPTCHTPKACFSCIANRHDLPLGTFSTSYRCASSKQTQGGFIWGELKEHIKNLSGLVD